jgi:excisionase family DNA binding protein
MFQPRSEQPVEPILLTSRQAAKLLSIGERTLWRLSHDGPIPLIKIGKSVRYDRRDLLAWIARTKTQSAAERLRLPAA